MTDARLVAKARRVWPHLYAEATSGGVWVPYRHLKFASIAIAKAMWQAEVSGVGARIVVTMPPRHGKSEFISHRVPTWFLDNWPERHVILTTYETEFAIHWGRKVRNTIQETPGINVRIASDSSAAQRWSTSEGGGMVTAGVGGPITGRGGHLIVVDDPHKNWQEAQSQTIRDGIIDWFNSTLYTRAEPGATIIVLQTRWHERDLIGYLLAEHGDNWIEVRLPALAEDGDPLGRIQGEALCRDRYDEIALSRIQRAVGSMIWAGLYQQRPAPAEGRLVKLEWWRYHHGIVPGAHLVIQSWDTAFKKGEENAYTVGQTWVEGAAGYYLVDQVRDRYEYPELKRAIKMAANKWHPHSILIEDKASGQSAVQELRRDTRLPVIAVAPGVGDKLVRAQLQAPQIEAGRVYLPDNASWLQDYLHEWLHFPSSEFSDQVDATSQALDYLAARKGRVVTGAKILQGGRQN